MPRRPWAGRFLSRGHGRGRWRCCGSKDPPKDATRGVGWGILGGTEDSVPPLFLSISILPCREIAECTWPHFGKLSARVLRGGDYVLINRQMGEKCFDFGIAHVGG